MRIFNPDLGAGSLLTFVLLGLAVMDSACASFGATDDPLAGRDNVVPVVGTPVGNAFALGKIDKRVVIKHGESTTVPIVLERPAGQSDDVTVSVEPLPAGVTATPLTLRGAATRGEITLAAAADGLAGSFDLLIRADAGGVKATTPLALFVRGASGTIDTTFGDGGRQVVRYPGFTATGLRGRVRAKGRSVYFIAACGADTCTHRLSREGALDASYGGTIAITSPRVLAVDSQDRLVIGGGEGVNAVGRADRSGKVDPSFAGGIVALSGAPVDALDLSPNDEVYYSNYYLAGCRVRHLDSSGQSVLGFGDNGNGAKAWTWGGGSWPSAVFFRPTAAGAPGAFVIGAWRSAVPDGGFGTAWVGAGPYLAPVRPISLGAPVAANPGTGVRFSSGAMLAVGTGAGNRQLFLKLDAEGNPDPTWDTDGLATLENGRICHGVAAGPEGQVYCALSGPGDQVAKLAPNGKLDTSFGFNGVLSLPYAPTSEVADVAVDADGRILLLSSALVEGTTAAYVTRIWP